MKQRLQRQRASQRGFTLLELLVASVAGLFVVLAAFMLSRGATRLFASEGRVGNSQLNLRLGIDRLRQDLDRAAYMTTANIKQDPDSCPDPASLAFPVRLQSIYYQQGSLSTAGTETPASAANGLTPDKITISGNFSTTDSYLAATIEPSSSGGHEITLQMNFGSTARLMAAGETGSADAALKAVFAPGRMLRIRNDLGSSQYVVIQNAAINGAGRPVIYIANTPQYTTISGASVVKRCGARGMCLGCEINPVQMVRYEVRSLATDAKFGWAYAGEAGGVGDKDKYDLVRSELRPDGTVLPDSEEIVAEYAVDLGFAFGVDASPQMSPGNPYVEPNILNLAFGNAENARWGGDVLSGDTSVRPQRIRTVRYRLTTRTRFGDYNAATDDGGPGLGRYKLGTDRYARARTITGEVSLTNQQGLRW